MTPEQKREQILKRILPALVICVIYFVFIRGLITEKVQLADENYQNLYRKGISPASLPGMRSQMSRIQSEVSALQKKQQNYREQLKGMAGFLSQKQSSNKSTARLSEIMAQFNIQVLEENSEKMQENNLPPAVKEVREWLLKSGDEKQDFIQIQRLRLAGSYPDMYQAMLQMAKAKFPAIPVYLTMLPPDEKNYRHNNQQHWELALWM